MLITKDLFEKNFSKTFGNWSKDSTLAHTLPIFYLQFLLITINFIPSIWRLFLFLLPSWKQINVRWKAAIASD